MLRGRERASEHRLGATNAGAVGAPDPDPHFRQGTRLTYHHAMSRNPGALSLLGLVSVLALPAVARADLPPPDGKKFVAYGFVVENVKAFPDYVLLAFPWSLSNGAPTKEHALVEEGKTVRLGRRSSAPKLYPMKRGEYETWKASYKPTHEFDDPALEALFSGKRVLPCGVELTPKTMIEKSDPRDEVVDALRVESISASACKVALAKTAPPAATAKPEAPPSPSTAASAPAPAPNAPAKPPGCGGCAAQPEGEPGFAFWSALTLGALLRRRRRLEP